MKAVHFCIISFLKHIGYMVHYLLKYAIICIHFRPWANRAPVQSKHFVRSTVWQCCRIGNVFSVIIDCGMCSELTSIGCRLLENIYCSLGFNLFTFTAQAKIRQATFNHGLGLLHLKHWGTSINPRVRSWSFQWSHDLCYYVNWCHSKGCYSGEVGVECV